MNSEQYMTFAVIITVLLLSPGPSVLLSMNNGLNYGKRLAAIGVLGNVMAFQLLMIISASGLGAIMISSDGLLTIIKVIGIGYLCYLGGKTYFSPVTRLGLERSQPLAHRRPWSIVKQAFLVTSLNPKALVFVSALLPQYIDSSRALLPQITVYCMISAVIHFTIYFGYATLATKLTTFVEHDKGRRVLNKVSGVIFLMFGCAMAFFGFRT